MIFTKTHHLIPEHKTQTRRPVKPGEYAWPDTGNILAVYFATGRLKWALGFDYAIQPGRGKKAIGRTPPIREIRRERLQEINGNDCKAEGIYEDMQDKWRFALLWDSLYRPPHDWASNPRVWALDWKEER